MIQFPFSLKVIFALEHLRALSHSTVSEYIITVKKLHVFFFYYSAHVLLLPIHSKNVQQVVLVITAKPVLVKIFLSSAIYGLFYAAQFMVKK